MSSASVPLPSSVAATGPCGPGPASRSASARPRPAATSADEYFARFDAGEHGVTAAPWAEPEAGRYAWIAPVPDFDPAAWLDEQVIAGSDTFTQHALAASIQAVRDAGGDFDPLRTGVVLGVTMAGARALLDA